MINKIFEVEHNPHYINRYLKFINSIKELGERTHLITEKHHILPSKLWPEFKNLRQNKWNMVKLTYREHFIAHLILFKCFCGNRKIKMLQALNFMMKHSKKSSVYQIKRTEWFLKFGKGENHPNFGNTHSPETRNKISEFRKNFTGWKHSKETKSKISNTKTGKLRSEETKKKISESHIGKILSSETKEKISKTTTGKIVSEETKAKMSESRKGEKHPLFGKTHSDETRKKMSESHKGETSPMRGKTHSDETRKKMSEAHKGEKHPMFGKPRSEETKAKISESKKGKLRGPYKKKNPRILI
jgi:hypothetical protein